MIFSTWSGSSPSHIKAVWSLLVFKWRSTQLTFNDFHWLLARPIRRLQKMKTCLKHWVHHRWTIQSFPLKNHYLLLLGIHKLKLIGLNLHMSFLFHRNPIGPAKLVDEAVDPLLWLWNLFPKKSSIGKFSPRILHDDRLSNGVNHENFETREILKRWNYVRVKLGWEFRLKFSSVE